MGTLSTTDRGTKQESRWLVPRRGKREIHQIHGATDVFIVRVNVENEVDRPSVLEDKLDESSGY